MSRFTRYGGFKYLYDGPYDLADVARGFGEKSDHTLEEVGLGPWLRQ